MTKDIAKFIGSKYMDTVGVHMADLAKIISEDIKSDVKKGNLPKGYYTVDAFESIAGYSIAVDGCLDSFLEDSDKEFYKQKILDMVNDYNYFKGSASLEEKDRRFYNEDVVLW